MVGFNGNHIQIEEVCSQTNKYRICEGLNIKIYLVWPKDRLTSPGSSGSHRPRWCSLCTPLVHAGIQTSYLKSSWHCPKAHT